MHSIQSWRRGLLMLSIAVLAITPIAAAPITPESDVLLPWFEIDLDHREVGLTTSFSVVNASPVTVRTRFTVYSNWGIPLLEVPVDFHRTEVKTIDLRAWIAHGRLPHRTLTAAELGHLQSALTGKASPVDQLYYGSPFQEGVAVGYVIAQTLDDRPDSLWGDTYSVDETSNHFGAETLTALGNSQKADCKRHGIRFVNEGRLYEGAELIVWSGRRLAPSATPTPSGARMKVTVGVYDQAGHHVQDCQRELIAVEPLQICRLDITPPIGWLDVRTEDRSVILEHLHSTSRASAELHSYCLPENLELAGPSITIEKTIDGDDADSAGATFTAGDEVEFEYHVTNNGTVPLAPVTVLDDGGLDVSCPEHSLDPGQSMVCEARTIAEGCLQGDVATATGRAPDGARVVASDIAYYEGLYAPALSLETLVNDDEADQPPGPVVDTGTPLHWTFVLTNSGNARVGGIAVSRKNGEPATCPKAELDPGESMTCTAESIAGQGQQHDVGTGSGSDPCGSPVVATDPAYYLGRPNAPAIAIRKTVGENDADTPPGPTVPVGETIEWRFIVTNTGNLPLQDIVVVDDQRISPACPKTALAPGESMTCIASSPALPCQHSNTATVTGTAAERERTVSASDVAHYFGEGHPALGLELKVNGDAADEPPGPWIEADTTILFTYEVTNTGNVELTNVVVSDERDRTATCPRTSLAPGESMVCTASTLAVAGTHEAVGSASARPACGTPVDAQDPAYYRGRALTASIDVTKTTNGVHAETPPGPSIELGSPVQWTYVVTNTGTLQLTGVSVTDSREVPVTCPKTVLEPGESMTCTAAGIAQACQYSNTATVEGHSARGETVSASDVAHYFGEGHPALGLELKVNGDAADEPPGPWIEADTTILFTYEVTNTGNVELTNVIVSDERDRTATCPKTSLAPGESMVCTASTLAVAGTHEIVGSASARPGCGAPVEAQDPAYYRGRALTASIDVTKMTNGVHAETPPGPSIELGSPVQWTYVVTNTGTLQLTGVSVTDSREAPVTCPKTVLEPGESMTCTAAGIAQSCQYSNTATVEGHSARGETVTARDDSFYLGQHHAAIAIDKRTNGEDAPQPPGLAITAGAAVQWTFAVTNTGDVSLTGVLVTDDRAGAVTCPKSALAPAESMTCSASGTALAGQQTNIAGVTGNPPCGDVVTATDASHYRGVVPAIQMEKLINGQDADDSAHAVALMAGTAVLWSFVVTNTGDVALSDVAVTDAPARSVTCPKNTLAPGESMTCTASGIASPGLDCDTATVVGTSPQGTHVTSSDSACYHGNTASIAIEKKTNGNDADTPPGPEITAGATVYWTYVVTNTGDLQVTAVSVTDNRGLSVSCPKTALAPGESMTCTASGTATIGQYSNIGTATGTAAGGTPVTASDPSHYIGGPVGNQGCTGSFWKNHTDLWPPTGYSPSQQLTTMFPSAALYPSFNAVILLDALNFSGGSGVSGAAEILLRAAIGAVLNASHPNVNYPRSPFGVMTDVNTALQSQNRDVILALAAALDADNNLGCPLN